MLGRPSSLVLSSRCGCEVTVTPGGGPLLFGAVVGRLVLPGGSSVFDLFFVCPSAFLFLRFFSNRVIVLIRGKLKILDSIAASSKHHAAGAAAERTRTPTMA